MKRLLDKIAEYITDNEKIGACLFLFIFVTRVFLDLVIEKILGLGEEWQHYIFAFYKYNYVIIVGYMFIYEIFYLYRYHRFHFTKIQWIGIIYALIAIIATYVNLKDELAYDYYTKLSLGEMIMASVFMLDVGRKLKHHNFKKILKVCAVYFLGLTFIINVFSLLVLFFNITGSFTLFGRAITIPFHYDITNSPIGSFSYAGFYYNSSIAGLCYSLGIILLVWLYKTKFINSSSFVVSILVNLYCLYLSENRTGVIGLLVFFFLMLNEYINKHIENKNSKRLSYALVLSVLFGVFLFILFRKLGDLSLINNLFSNPFEALDTLTSKRFRILVSVLNIVKNKPLLGNGWNSVIPVEKNGTIYNYPYAHNIFLGALAWTGCIGLLIFIYYFYLLIKHSLKTAKTEPSCRIYLFITLSIIAQSQFENGILGDWNHAYTYLFWLIIGFISFSQHHR